MHGRARGEAWAVRDRQQASQQERSPANPLRASVGRSAHLEVQRWDAGTLLALQRSAGNRAVAGAMTRSATPQNQPSVQRDDADTPTTAAPTTTAPTTTAPTTTGPTTTEPPGTVRLLPGSLFLADTGEFLRNRPTLAPSGVLPVLPPGQITGLIDWGDIGTAYRNRKLTLENRDRELIIGHWQRWYPVAQALHRLPGASALFDTPAAIMNTMSGKMIDSALSGDKPDVIERFNRQAEQFGVSTTTVSVTVKRF